MLARPVRGLPFGVRFLALALVIGGGIGAISSFLLIGDLWVWPMPELAHRFLAAAAAGYVAGGAVALVRRSWEEQELLMVTVLLYAIPLIPAVLIGRDEVDWATTVPVAFLGIVAAAVAICAVFLPRAARRPHEADLVSSLSEPVLLALGAAGLVVGAIVYLGPRDAGWIWPWADLNAWTPLTTRLIATMLLTIGGGAMLVAYRRSRGAFEIFAAMLVAYCAVAAAGLAIHAEKTPSFRTEDLVYVGVFGVIAAGAAALFVAERRATARG